MAAEMIVAIKDSADIRWSLHECLLENPNEYKLELCEVRIFISIPNQIIHQSVMKGNLFFFFFITAHDMWLIETTIF